MYGQKLLNLIAQVIPKANLMMVLKEYLFGEKVVATLGNSIQKFTGTGSNPVMIYAYPQETLQSIYMDANCLL